MDEAAPQTALGKTAGDLDLAALRHGWGEAYLIGCDDERGWHASRRDRVGGLITGNGPDDLWAAIVADYQFKPVPRDYSKPFDDAAPDADDDLPPGQVLRDTDSDEPS